MTNINKILREKLIDKTREVELFIKFYFVQNIDSYLTILFWIKKNLFKLLILIINQIIFNILKFSIIYFMKTLTFHENLLSM